MDDRWTSLIERLAHAKRRCDEMDVRVLPGRRERRAD
jgi:hypothetical protein